MYKALYASAQPALNPMNRDEVDSAFLALTLTLTLALALALALTQTQTLTLTLTRWRH